ncbi:MAG: L-threonylcarbamoyladenylate synthase, partial [Bacteroidota bacterium]
MLGHISPTLPGHVKDSFGERSPVILDGGACNRGLESTIIGFDGNIPVIYRLGAITEDELRCVGPAVKLIKNFGKKPLAPGMFPKHYAPRTRTVLTDDIAKVIKREQSSRIGILSYSKSYYSGVQSVEVLSESGELQEAARNLYSALHRLDAAGLDLIIAEFVPDHGLGRAINDRLRRAVADTVGIGGNVK